MIRFYTNRDLAGSLGINLAKWKRWSREFLPPDPLGGLQSGYARQYSFYQAFKVYIGGVLVSELKFPIPQAERILSDIGDWIETPEILFPANGRSDAPVRCYQIWICRIDDSDPSRSGFSYRLRGILADLPADYRGQEARQTFYREVQRPPPGSRQGVSDPGSLHVLDITKLADGFNRALQRKT